MQQSEVQPSQLRHLVEAEFLHYVVAYKPPAEGQTLGTPWSKGKVKAEVDEMSTLLVDPYPIEYESNDDLLSPEKRLTGIRGAFVVAEDLPYFLLYDYQAEDFVLACKHEGNGKLAAWGIRGDATSTFLAR